MKSGRWICFSLLIAAAMDGYAAAPWHHPLSYSQGGYWRARVHVDVTNSGDRNFEGESVQIAIGELRFAGQSAAALRVVDAKGRELLFAVMGPGGATRHDTTLAADDVLFFRIDCPAGATERFWVYADNPAAMVVPDFLQSGFVNGDFEFGNAAPHGWETWGNDSTHQATWVTENPHSGKYCTKTVVQEGADANWVKWMQGNIPLTVGVKYRVSAWAKSAGVKGSVGWFIHVNGVRSQMINRSLNIDPAPRDWRRVSTEFVCPEGASSVTIGTLLHGTGVAYFDDASVEALTETSTLELTVGEVETLRLSERCAPGQWQLDRDKWRCRTEVRVINMTDTMQRDVVVNAALTRAVVLARRYGPVTALRVVGPDGHRLPHVSFEDPRSDMRQTVGGGQVQSEVRTGDSVLFVADIPARCVCYFHVYFSSEKDATAGETMAGTELIRSKANLVRNGDFETGGDDLPNWSTSTENSDQRNCKIASGGIVGDRCIETTVAPTAELNWTGWRQLRVPIRPGARYLYASYLKTQDVTNGTVRLHGHWKTAEQMLATSPFFSVGKEQAGGTDWTLNMGTVRAPADASFVDLHLTMNARGAIYHDGVLFCEIAQGEAGAFQPAKAPASSSRNFDVWEANPIVKVFPDDPPGEPTEQVRMAAVRNECEVFQLVVRPNRDLRDFTVTCSQFSGLDSPVEISRVGYVPIDNRSSYFRSDLPDYYRKVPDNAGRTDGWVGDWPDPIPPFRSTDLRTGRNMPLWFTVRVPANAKPGEYHCEVTLGAQDTTTVVIPVTLTVWPFTLPSKSNLKVIYDLRQGRGGGVFTGEDKMKTVKMWMKFLADHRVSPGLLNFNPELQFVDGEPTFDFTEFDEIASYCFDDLDMNVMYTPWYFYAFGWAYKVKSFNGHEAFTPEYVKAFTSAYRKFFSHLKAKGWYDEFVYYISDEPHYHHEFVVQQMKKMCDLVHKADPHVPIYSSTWRHVPEWNDYLDIWGVGQYGCFPVEEMAARIKAGRKLWFTTDGQMATDTPYCGTERLLPYYCLKYGAEGYEFWGVSWWTYDPWKYGWHWFIRQSPDGEDHYYVRYPNGDGYLAYPGKAVGQDEPVSTVRLAQAREGVEDYEYFVILQDRIAKATQQNIDTSKAKAVLDAARALVTIPNAGGYRSTDIMPDPDAIPRVRQQVAEQIISLGRALGAK